MPKTPRGSLENQPMPCCGSACSQSFIVPSSLFHPSSHHELIPALAHSVLSCSAADRSPWCFRSELCSPPKPSLSGILGFRTILSLICLVFTRPYEIQPTCASKLFLKRLPSGQITYLVLLLNESLNLGLSTLSRFSSFQTCFPFLNTLFLSLTPVDTDHHCQAKGPPLKVRSLAWYGEFQRTHMILAPGDPLSHCRESSYTEKERTSQ